MKKSNKGFTLVELIVVIAVLALLAVGAVMAIIGVQNNARNSTARSMATGLADHLNQVSTFDRDPIAGANNAALVTAARRAAAANTGGVSGWSTAPVAAPAGTPVANTAMITWRMYLLNERPATAAPWGTASPAPDYSFSLPSGVVWALIAETGAANGAAAGLGEGNLRYQVIPSNGIWVVHQFNAAAD